MVEFLGEASDLDSDADTVEIRGVETGGMYGLLLESTESDAGATKGPAATSGSETFASPVCSRKRSSLESFDRTNQGGLVGTGACL